ncbi:MAG TPA: DUF1428 domain-containing protein [Casimicrobiaceae bacterium]|nr:DUF1428 domain-containing protein [Casimicrobiaceae bacterium]
MSHYIDAIVIPVPRASLDTCKRMSAEWGKAHLRHGALYYSDSISDDAQPSKVTSFPQVAQLKDDEVIALAWVVYRDKGERDRINKAVMEDPQFKESMDLRRCPLTASACSGVASRPSSGSRPATNRPPRISTQAELEPV